MNVLYGNYAPSFLFAEKYNFPEKWVYAETKCPYSMFRYICSGTAEFKVDGVSYSVKAGDVFYIPQGCLLYCKAYEEIEFISIRFFGTVQLPGEDMLNKLWGIEQIFHYQDRPYMRDYFEKVYSSAISKDSYKRLITRGYLNLICADLAAQSSKDTEPFEEDRVLAESLNDVDYLRDKALEAVKNTDPKVNTLVEYITLHPEKNPTNTQLCNMIGVGESTLRRIFKKETGKTIYEFINERKMRYAAHLLVTTLESVSEISYQLGYETPSYFSKLFRENYGVSPLTYRKNSKEA